MIWDDGTGTPGIVGPSLPEVRAKPNPNPSAPVLTSVERVSAAAEVNADWKPMHDYHRDGGDATLEILQMSSTTGMQLASKAIEFGAKITK